MKETISFSNFFVNIQIYIPNWSPIIPWSKEVDKKMEKPNSKSIEFLEIFLNSCVFVRNWNTPLE